jgi:hypothetical protein
MVYFYGTIKKQTMYKIINKDSDITPFGGLIFIENALNQTQVGDLITKSLGTRNARAKYTYFDVMKSLFYNAICQGEYVSDLELLRARMLKKIQPFIPSHDTVEYASQELKTENLVIEINEKSKHQINENSKFNELLPKLVKKLGLLKNKSELTLDFDHVINENEKFDSVKTYKHTNGYNPCFANIGDLTVYYENRNGNTPAKFRQKEAFENCFKNLNNNEIKINKVRADSASYQKEVIDLVESEGVNFYIRNVTSAKFRDICTAVENWEKVSYNNETLEVASVKYRPFDGKTEYRVVVQRRLFNEKDELFEELKYAYYGIITNDLEMNDLGVIQFYNQRGHVSENYNKNLLNDFNIKHLPFMDLDTNTVFMGFMAACGILFEWLKSIMVKNKVQGVEIQHRVKRFFFKYVSVCAKIVRHAGRETLQIFGKDTYNYLII